MFHQVYKSEALFSRVLQTLLLCIQSKPGTRAEYQYEYGRVNSHSCKFMEQLVSRRGIEVCRERVVKSSLEIVVQCLEESINLDDQLQQLHLLALLQRFLLAAPGLARQLTDLEKLLLSERLFSLLMVGLKLGEKYLIRTRYLTMLLTALYSCKEVRLKFLEEGLTQLAESLLELIARTGPQQGSAQEGYQNLLNLRDALRLGLRLVFRLTDSCEKKERQEKSLTGLLPTLVEHGIRVDCEPSEYAHAASLMYAKLPSFIASELRCWELCPAFQKVCRLTTWGLPCTPAKQLPELMLEAAAILQLNERNEVREDVVSMMTAFLEHHKHETVDYLLAVWLNSVESSLEDRQEKQGSEMLFRVIEVLAWMKCPANFMVDALLESYCMKNIKAAGDKRPVMPKGLLFLDEPLAKQEVKVLYFLYTFCLYCAVAEMKAAGQVKFWSGLIKLSRIFISNGQPQSILWLLDILAMASAKFSTKELFNDSKYRNDLLELITALYAAAGQYAIQHRAFTTKRDFEAKFFGLGSLYDSDPNRLEMVDVVAPLNPSLFSLEQQCRQR